MSVDTLRIEKLVFGGHGFAKDGKGVVLIPDAAAGDVVEVEENGAKGGVRSGRIVKIVDPSPHRREPPCPYAGECGGCDWLHLYYDEQVRCKKDILIECLTRIGKFDYPHDVEIFTADEFGYRIRAQIKVDYENGCAGFFRKKTNDVVRVDSCLLLDERLNGVLAGLNGEINGLRRHARNDVIARRCIELAELVYLGVSQMSESTKQSGRIDSIGSDSNINSCDKTNAVSSIKVLVGDSVASDPVIDGLTDAATEINVSGIKFLADGGSFFQSNGFLLERLGRWAKGCLGGGFCLDLYGGIGFFSLMLADDFEEIILVENVAGQIRAAERNFAVNKKNGLTAVLADVERGGGLRKIAGGRRPDCVVVDPPRPGLVKAVRKWLTDTAPSRVLYVSCNPSTFARDAGALLAGGYKLTKLALFDLYPNTHHTEVAGIFAR
ncbi:MAG: 23S rRNA (uracil(1939)-C(5))-methyltransferase RlmD [Chitinispirillales bacterium]|jgi:23S rRNA (uracil1939-C5)-methyltransferase|nr:23S rRNA (uracil(1939)-C(5))-methyltransferase RlmD [Chitinispirillales bacterium]